MRYFFLLILLLRLLVEEEDDDGGEDDERAEDDPEGRGARLEGKLHIHAEEAGDHRQRQHDGGEVGQHPHNLVGAVGQQRVEGLRQALD